MAVTLMPSGPGSAARARVMDSPEAAADADDGLPMQGEQALHEWKGNRGEIGRVQDLGPSDRQFRE